MTAPQSASAFDRARLSNPALLRSAAYVDGLWIEADPATAIVVTDPFTGETAGHAPSLASVDIDAAIAAAERAFADWSRRPARERGALLRRWLELIERDKEDLARLITRVRTARPLKEARAEVGYGSGFVEFYAEEAGRILGEIIPSPTPGRRLMVEREPIGGVRRHHALELPHGHCSPARSPRRSRRLHRRGQAASQTPLTALALAVLAEEAGIPPGVVNVVTGKASMIGERLTASPVVRKISFTGSTEVGARLMAASAATIKRLSLELGGNAPLLVFDDADLQTAVETAMVAKSATAARAASPPIASTPRRASTTPSSPPSPSGCGR
ncbi:MAG: aldehyde dehydrogenase family protein [Caulobacteraceae bacterium]